MEKISLCMIVKNESKNIARCLKSIKKYVHEMIVVDTGSTDDTIAVAQSLGAKVFNFEWEGDFSAARNFSLEKACGNWILFLDADEELLAGSGEKLLEIVNEKDVTGYFVKIVNYIGYDGAYETTADIVFRLFRNSPEYRFHGAIHEQIVDVILKENPQAKYLKCEEIVIVHYGYTENEIASKDKKKRNLEIIKREMQKNPSDLLMRYHYGVELFRNEEYFEAAQELSTVAQHADPNSYIFPKMLRYITIALLNAKKYAEGEYFAANALKFCPDYADLYYFRGLIYFEQKKYVQANADFKQALAMPEQPTHYATFYGIRGYRSKYYLGKIAEEFLNLEEALSWYISALRENPYFISALEEIIRILNPRLEPDYTKECLEKTFKFENTNALVTVARICYQYGGYELALEFLGKIDASAIRPEINLMRAVSFIQIGDYFSAVRILKEFPTSISSYPIVLVNLFFCYWLQENKAKVRNLAQKLFNLGISAETVSVINLYKDIFQKKPAKNFVILKGNAIPLFLELFERTVDRGKLEMAEKLIERLDKETLKELNYSIGKTYLKHGYYKEAQKFLLLAHTSKPEDREVLYELGLSFENSGDKFSAIQYYRKGIADKNAEPKFYLKIIGLYQEMLKEALQEAVKLYPASEEITKMLAETGESL